MHDAVLYLLRRHHGLRDQIAALPVVFRDPSRYQVKPCHVDPLADIGLRERGEFSGKRLRSVDDDPPQDESLAGRHRWQRFGRGFDDRRRLPDRRRLRRLEALLHPARVTRSRQFRPRREGERAIRGHSTHHANMPSHRLSDAPAAMRHPSDHDACLAAKQLINHKHLGSRVAVIHFPLFSRESCSLPGQPAPPARIGEDAEFGGAVFRLEKRM